MLLTTLLPRPLDHEAGSECATLMGALLTAVHLNRRRARALGFRGIRPSGTMSPAWTARIAGCEPVYGLVFEGERQESANLCGSFAAYAFPHPESPLLDVYPLEAMRRALAKDYEDMVRSLSRYAEDLRAFQLGTVSMTVSLDGTGLLLSLRALARLRVAAQDGVCVPGTENLSSPDWLVAQGGYETDVPAYKTLLPFFAALASSAQSVLAGQAQDGAEAASGALPQPMIALRMNKVPVPSFDRHGLLGTVSGAAGTELLLQAGFGSQEGAGRRLKNLPMRHKPRQEESGLPVLHILTGFLGAGKTTFLRQWLDYLHGRERYTGVIQNELGETGLDAALLHGETMVEQLDDGCVCCSLADSMRPGLIRLLKAMPAEQCILETSGVANPANIMAAMADLADLVQPGLVITVVDALALSQEQEKLSGIRLFQVLQADVLIVNKADAVTDRWLEALMAELKAVNRQALMLPARHGSIAFGELDAFYSAWLDGRAAPLPSQTLHLADMARLATHGQEGYAAKVLPLTRPLDEAGLHRLLAAAGPGLCRAKGLADMVLEDGSLEPWVVQYAAGRLAYEKAPEAEGRYLVFIGKGLRLPEEEAAEGRGQSASGSTGRDGTWN